MQASKKMVAIAAVAVAVTIYLYGNCFGHIVVGQSAPDFSLKDVNGKHYELSMLTESMMTILLFLDLDSRPSISSLQFLDKLAKRYDATDFKVWAIAQSSEEKIKKIVAQYKLTFADELTIPILIDRDAAVSELYDAVIILPTTCIIGPQLKVLDVIQGGGKTTEVMLARLAERQLQRNQLAFAKAISDSIIAENPQSIDAKIVKAYAALKEGDLEASERVFREISKISGSAQISGLEGLAEVYAQKGQVEKALKLAQEVESKAPQRGRVNLVKAEFLYAQGKKNEAEIEYKKAVEKSDTSSYAAAKAYNQLGRIQADEGHYINARDLYDKAIQVDPFYIEATTNKGITYEKEGQFEEAQRLYAKALSLAAEVDRAIITMKKANIAFNVPESMNLSDVVEIVLILDMAKTSEALAQLIRSVGKKEGATVSVTNRMGADLSGSHFKITPISKEVQVITALNETEWRWEISPMQTGEHSIHLSLNAYFNVNGHDTPKMIQTFNKTIRIKVTWVNLAKSFFQSNWQWLWTSLFIPVVIWLWRKRKES